MPKKKKGPDKATLHDQLSVDDPRSASAPDAAEEKGSEELSDDGSIKSLHKARARFAARLVLHLCCGCGETACRIIR